MIKYCMFLIHCFLISIVSWFAENKTFRLSRTFYPRFQQLDISFNSSDFSIAGETEIFVENLNFYAITDTILINYAKLSIHRVRLFDEFGRKIRSNVDFFEDRETMVITMSQTAGDIPFRNIKILLKFSKKYKELEEKTGLYQTRNANGETAGFVTLFQPSFARTLFPCFDEPFFRTIFSLNLKIFEDPKREFDLILFNSNKREKIRTNHYDSHLFEQTVPIPSYLVAVAILKSRDFSKIIDFQYLNIPIEIYRSNAGSALRKKSELELIQKVILFTLSYCEKKFGVGWVMSRKIVFLLTEMTDVLGGMEQPGLITGRLFLYSRLAIS